MSTAQLAVLVLACALGDTDTCAAATVTTVEVGAERTFRTIAIFRTGWKLRAEAVAPAVTRLTLGTGIAKAVRVRIVLTVHESNTAVSTTGRACLTPLCQGNSRNCGGQGGACYGTGNAAHRGTAGDFFVSQSFGDVFEPISHRHLLILT